MDTQQERMSEPGEFRPIPQIGVWGAEGRGEVHTGERSGTADLCGGLGGCPGLTCGRAGLVHSCIPAGAHAGCGPVLHVPAPTHAARERGLKTPV